MNSTRYSTFDPNFTGFGIDLEALCKRATSIAENTSSEWRSAHLRLLAEIQTTFQQAINIVLGKLRSMLGKPLNGWKFECSKRPSQVRIDAENALLALRQRSLDFQENWKNVESRDAPPDLSDPKTTNDWLKFTAVLAVFIVIEAAANVSLLASVLPTGMLGAFITAVLVSTINVAALGAGSGLLMSSIHRNSAYRRWLGPACALWGLLVLGLNLLVGRHREAFARIIDESARQGPQAVETDMAMVLQEIARDISFNPVAWNLESLLFFLLGIALCAAGFYKGYTFMKPGVRRSQERKHLADERTQVLEEFNALSQEFRKILTDKIRPEVAGWVEELALDNLEAKNRFEDLEQDWTEEISLHSILSHFVIAYNINHVDEIDLKMLQKHRESLRVGLSFPATPADRTVLKLADEQIADWTNSGQEEFFSKIADEAKHVDDLWKKYEKVICGPLKLSSN